jgi:hypothetical protein
LATITISASGTVLLAPIGQALGVEGRALRITESGTVSLVLAQNTAPPGAAVSLSNVAYRTFSGEAVAAGTAITTSQTVIVSEAGYDLYVVATVTAGSVAIDVAPANDGLNARALQTAREDGGYQNAGQSSFPGQVASALADLLGQSLDVRAFGAVGDGVTDDTVAIQAACANGGAVFVPDGIYMTSSAITLPSNTLLFGNGRGRSIIRAMAAHTGTVITNTGAAGAGNTGIVVRDIEVDGNKGARGSGANLVHFTCLDNGSTNSDIHVRHLYAHDSPELGVIFSHVRGGSVLDVEVADNDRDGLTFYFDCWDIRVDDVRIHDCEDDFIGLNAENQTTTGHVMKNFTMSNLVLGPGGDSQGSGLSIRGAVNVSVDGFVIDEGFAEGVGISNWNTTAATDIHLANGSILNAGANNTGGTGFGVSLVAARSVSSLAGVAGVARVTVANVSVLDSRTYGVRLINSDPLNCLIQDVTFDAVQVNGTDLNTSSRNFYGDTDGVEDVTFRGCISREAQLQGWLIDGVWKRTKFHGCRAFNSGLAVGSGSTSAVGLSLIDCVDTEVIGGTYTDTQATKTQRNGIRVTTCTGALALIGVDCRGNDVSSFSLNDTAGLAALRIRDCPGFSPWAGEVSIASGGWTGPTTLGGIDYYYKEATLTYNVPFPSVVTPEPLFTTNVTGVSASGLSGSATQVTVRAWSLRNDGPAVVVAYDVEPTL